MDKREQEKAATRRLIDARISPVQWKALDAFLEAYNERWDIWDRRALEDLRIRFEAIQRATPIEVT